MVIKGPFSYSGNKYRIWNKYLKNVMKHYEKIHEPFVGSGVCMYNSNLGGNSIDIDLNVVALHNALKDPNLVSKIEECYNSYFLGTSNMKQSFLKLRNDFNELYLINNYTDSSNVHMLYVLIQLSFNSLLRFGPNGYNVPYGEKLFDLDRIKLHSNISLKKSIYVEHGTYRDLDLSKINKQNDLIYFDPPYIASKFQYGGWNKENELDLLNYIDELNELGYFFILSNTFSHRGVDNNELINWSKTYNTRLIEMTYNAWSARVSGVQKEENTVEVLITNINDVFGELTDAHNAKTIVNNLF